LLPWKSNILNICLVYPPCCVILPPVVCLSVLYFSHYLNNGMISGKSLLNIKCMFWFTLQLLFETFLISRRIQQDIKVHRSSYKVPILLVTFELNMNYFDSTSSDIKFLNKLYSAGLSCYMWTDGWKAKTYSHFS
jgi:hypothetical protein